MIGEIFDKVYPLGSLGRSRSTTSRPWVSRGGSTVVEMKLEVPGNYILVDHALSRVEHGAAGFLEVEGPSDDTIFHVN